jgi:hypothetical protein
MPLIKYVHINTITLKYFLSLFNMKAIKTIGPEWLIYVGNLEGLLFGLLIIIGLTSCSLPQGMSCPGKERTYHGITGEWEVTFYSHGPVLKGLLG